MTIRVKKTLRDFASFALKKINRQDAKAPSFFICVYLWFKNCRHCHSPNPEGILGESRMSLKSQISGFPYNFL
jgi:hypothetical protein